MKVHRKFYSAFTIVELLIVIVVIAILAAITIVSYNGITGQAKASARLAELSQWRSKAELHKVRNGIACPEGYVFVYGNSTLGTSDFCVMKYEAKIQGNDNGLTAYSASFVPESRASGTPWVNISQSQAAARAAATGGRLLTDAEWMTIAADVLSVKYNWSGGAVGSGYIYQGHVSGTPAAALDASADDSNADYQLTGTAANSRVLYLTSGDAIWDFSGNVYEMTGTLHSTIQIGVSGDTAFTWRDWNNTSLSLGNLPDTSKPSTLASLAGLSGITGWDSSHGIGRVYANYADSNLRVLRRGGRWGGAAAAGVLSLTLSSSPVNTDPATGFRMAR